MSNKRRQEIRAKGGKPKSKTRQKGVTRKTRAAVKQALVDDLRGVIARANLED